MKTLDSSPRLLKVTSLVIKKKGERERASENKTDRQRKKEKKERSFLCHISGKCCLLIQQGPFLEMARLHYQGLLKALC